MNFEADSATSHPFHLHGGCYCLLEQGTGTQWLNGGNSAYKNSTKKPICIDVITVPPGGYAIVRFIADNPGVWFFHCHIEPHMHTGMQGMFKVGEKKDWIQPPEDFPKCGVYKPDIKTCAANSKELNASQ